MSEQSLNATTPDPESKGPASRAGWLDGAVGALYVLCFFLRLNLHERYHQHLLDGANRRGWTGRSSPSSTQPMGQRQLPQLHVQGQLVGFSRPLHHCLPKALVHHFEPLSRRSVLALHVVNSCVACSDKLYLAATLVR